MTIEERIFILQSFFHAHWDNMIKPYPRYWELLRQRGFHPAADSLAEIQRYFTVQDFLDLQVWYNLVWIDPSFFKEFELLEKLVSSDRNFNETEKNNLLKIQKTKFLAALSPPTGKGRISNLSSFRPRLITIPFCRCFTIPTKRQSASPTILWPNLALCSSGRCRRPD